MIRPISCLSIPGLLALAMGGPVVAAEPSGTAVAVLQSADVLSGGARRVLQVSAAIYSGDRVNTGPRGEAQLRFRDQTKMVVGANSSLLIDKFVFNPDNSARRISISAVKGAFRFITGQSAKSAYTITTPSATIGVRGTRFDFTVAGGVTTFALYEGGARVCKRGGQCVELRGRCEVAVIPSGNPIRRVPGGVARSQILAAQFPYVRSQSRLLPEFRADTSSCAVTRADIPGGTLTPAGVAPPGDPGSPPGDPGSPPGDPGTAAANHSGLGDASNPGWGAGPNGGSANSNSGNSGASNPGGSKK
jgi:hypothetical protein